MGIGGHPNASHVGVNDSVVAKSRPSCTHPELRLLMIEMVLSHVDLARMRFAHSPIGELVASLLILQEQSRLKLDLLLALAPAGRYLPDFVMPPPTQPWGVLADELNASWES